MVVEFQDQDQTVLLLWASEESQEAMGSGCAHPETVRTAR